MRADGSANTGSEIDQGSGARFAPGTRPGVLARPGVRNSVVNLKILRAVVGGLVRWIPCGVRWALGGSEHLRPPHLSRGPKKLGWRRDPMFRADVRPALQGLHNQVIDTDFRATAALVYGHLDRTGNRDPPGCRIANRLQGPPYVF